MLLISSSYNLYFSTPKPSWDSSFSPQVNKQPSELTTALWDLYELILIIYLSPITSLINLGCFYGTKEY